MQLASPASQLTPSGQLPVMVVLAGSSRWLEVQMAMQVFGGSCQAITCLFGRGFDFKDTTAPRFALSLSAQPSI
jgi:hypothetical protein